MRKDLADITLVVDRSGSMQSIYNDAQGGINAFIAQQAELPGEAFISLVQFDTKYEFVAKGIPASEFPEYKLVPRGGTALLDAVGRAINETGQRLSRMNEQDRPGLVAIVVMTDGEENSSREFTRAEIKNMIEHQQTQYNWQFTFLGADQDAFAEAASMGVARAGAANFAKHKVMTAYQHTGSKFARMRQCASRGETIDNAYTEAELNDME